MSELEEPTPTGISRRTVTKAMAWAVPAIAIAAPVPAFAGASQGTVTLTGEACKLPGESSAPYNENGAVYIFTITNTTINSTTIDFTSVLRTGSDATDVEFSVVRLTGSGTCCTQLGTSVTANANTTDTFALVTGGWDNSANGQLTVAYDVEGDPQTPATTSPNSLESLTPGGSNCGIGGSCSISVARSKCILTAILVSGCTGSCS